jgi:hypothetical protein
MVATEPTSSPVAGLKLSRVDWAGGDCVALSTIGDGSADPASTAKMPPHLF